MSKQLPHVSNELMAHLESKFTLDLALKSETQNQLWFHKGIHHVLSHLRSIKDHQEKKGNILNVHG